MYKHNVNQYHKYLVIFVTKKFNWDKSQVLS